MREITPADLPTTEGSFRLRVDGSDQVERQNIREEDMPSDFVQHLIWGFNWLMPQTGPLVLTWSMLLGEAARTLFPNEASYKSESLLATQDDSRTGINQARLEIDEAFDRFEQVANIEFIEVANTSTSTGNIHFFFSSDNTDGVEGRAFNPHYGTTVDINLKNRNIGHSDLDWVMVHEVGHTLGLTHPFAEYNGWPGREEYRTDERTIMTYHLSDHSHGDANFLQPADIAALEFLYGKKGTNFDGVEALLARSGFVASEGYVADAVYVDDDYASATALEIA